MTDLSDPTSPGWLDRKSRITVLLHHMQTARMLVRTNDTYRERVIEEERVQAGVDRTLARWEPRHEAPGSGCTCCPPRRLACR